MRPPDSGSRVCLSSVLSRAISIVSDMGEPGILIVCLKHPFALQHRPRIDQILVEPRLFGQAQG